MVPDFEIATRHYRVSPVELRGALVACNEPRFFPSSQAIFSSLNSGSRMVIARAHRVAA